MVEIRRRLLVVKIIIDIIAIQRNHGFVGVTDVDAG